jgi:replication factor C subunit 2/4
MTSGAQQALRRTMEIYSNTTRFAFACNQSNKIIEPLQSRCAILRYSRLTDAQILKRLLEICQAEDIKYSDDGLAGLIFCAEGDMRQAINNLQSTVSGFGFVNGDNVFKVADSPHPIKVQLMLKCCNEMRLDDAVDNLQELWYVYYTLRWNRLTCIGTWAIPAMTLSAPCSESQRVWTRYQNTQSWSL